MKRIVVIASSNAGIECALGVKSRLPADEINLVLPAGLSSFPDPVGPASQRAAACLPNMNQLAGRDIGIIEAHELMPDLAKNEVVVSSTRGVLPVRFHHLVVETQATARIPRAIGAMANVFSWPQEGFAANPHAVDNALFTAASQNTPALVVGSGMAALDAVFGAHAGNIAITAVKSQIGHLLGASGGVAGIFAAKALQTGIVPGTINLDTPDPECDLNYMADGPRELHPRCALINSFGFGGTNASLLLRRYDA